MVASITEIDRKRKEKEKGRGRRRSGRSEGRAEEVSLAFGPNKLFMFVGLASVPAEQVESRSVDSEGHVLPLLLFRIAFRFRRRGEERGVHTTTCRTKKKG